MQWNGCTNRTAAMKLHDTRRRRGPPRGREPPDVVVALAQQRTRGGAGELGLGEQGLGSLLPRIRALEDVDRVGTREQLAQRGTFQHREQSRKASQRDVGKQRRQVGLGQRDVGAALPLPGGRDELREAHQLAQGRQRRVHRPCTILRQLAQLLASLVAQRPGAHLEGDEARAEGRVQRIPSRGVSDGDDLEAFAHRDVALCALQLRGPLRGDQERAVF
mmetsp:Transcript_15420/g.54035  ORF Transcript_15420/g.54035 Transcript_15420/m.54035 type:complete len:219 (-) Transcript_15420:638-1294(-)